MLETAAPWKQLTQKPEDALKVIGRATAAIRTASILLKPFIPKTAEIAYKSFTWNVDWSTVHYGNAVLEENRYVTASFENVHLFPRLAKE
jgi:methionyl-tRNA synthetase